MGGGKNIGSTAILQRVKEESYLLESILDHGGDEAR
jgi:hypothetical protein